MTGEKPKHSITTLNLQMDLEISVKFYRYMPHIQAERASHARARNLIFHKGLKKVVMQLFNLIKICLM